MRPLREILLAVALAILTTMVAIALAISGGLKMPSRAVGAPPKYSPNVPATITTPDTTKTRIGTLRFKDGTPEPETVELA
ncbi:MAG: hypothetical protein ACKO24_08185 [Leptolyngbyaceae cyanobacterium]